MKRFTGKRAVVLYTDIGRGHPNYLDSTLRAIKSRLGPLPDDFEVSSVFKISKGMSLFGWKTARRIYRAGSQGGIASFFYNRSRQRSGSAGRNKTLNIIGKSLRKSFDDYDGILLVAHPLLVQILGKICRVFYVHGEIASPLEFDISSAEKIFVPLKETADALISGNVHKDKIIITGLMLEPEIAAEANGIRSQRMKRISEGIQPTAGFFNSGAYPREHLWQVIEAAEHLLKNHLGRVIISTGNMPRMLSKFQTALSRYSPSMSAEEFVSGRHELLLLHDKDRENLTLQELKIIPQIDLAVMAAHERVNWTVGLGIPSILLHPNIGSFAPMNFEFARTNGLVFLYKQGRITGAVDRFITSYRDKDPDLMKTYKINNIDGAEKTADIILAELGIKK